MTRTLCLLLVIAAWLSPATAFAGGPTVGAAAPAFVGQTLNGEAFDLAAQRGHVAVVNLWATWCPPCRAEMPMLDAFYKAHRGAGVILVGLSADHRRDLGTVKRVMSAFSYPAALLDAARTNGFGAPDSLPMTYVVDAEGRIRSIFNGARAPLTEAVLAEAVQAAGQPARQ